MKIVFYISSLSGGGAEKVLCILANRLAKEGNMVHVVSLEKREQFYQLDEQVVLHKFSNKGKGVICEAYADIKAVRNFMRSISTNVSVSFLLRCNLIVLLSNIFNHEKIIVCDRNNPLKEHSKKVFKLSNLLYRRANKIVVQTKQIKEFYDSGLQNKIVVQENPLDTEALYKQLKGKLLVKENTVISIGRLEPQKDFVTLIKAFADLADEFQDWKLKIFGVGNMHNELQALIDSFDLRNQIILCGHTHEPFHELKKSKVFVLSTNYEGFPNVLCEAMEAGLMCISSDCVSGPRELIQNGKNGWLFNVGDVACLVLLLRNCMKKKSMPEIEKQATLSTQRLHLDSNIEEWKNIIKSVI